MTTVFGDFVFKVSAVVNQAAKNLKQWDGQMAKYVKDNQERAKKEKENAGFMQKAYTSFFNMAKAASLAFAYSVMKTSPQIRAEFQMMELHLRMLAMDMGQTWAPAFKAVSKALKEVTKWWRDLGKSGGIGEIIHDTVNWGIGILALLAAFELIGAAFTFIFGGGGLISAGLTALGTYWTAFLALLSAPLLIIFALIIAGVIGFISAWKENFGGIRAFVALMWQGIKDIFQGAWDFITGIFSALWGLLTGDTEKFKAGMIKAFEGLWKFIKGIFEFITGAVGTVILSFVKLGVDIGKVLADLVWEFIQWGANVFNSVVKAFKDIGKAILDWIAEKIKDITAFGGKIGDVFKNLGTQAMKWGKDIIQNLWDGIMSMGSWIKDKVTGFIDKYIPIKFDLVQNDKMAQKWGSDMIHHFGKGVQQGSTTQNFNINQPISINSGGSGGGSTDAYQIKSLTMGAMNQQFSKLKGIGAQYY